MTPPRNSPKLPSMTNFRRFSPPVVAVLLWILSPVYAPSAAPQSGEDLKRVEVSGTRGGNLVVAVSADPATMNRHISRSYANAMVLDRMCADLVHINRATLELEPALASSWDMSKDGRTYTLHLRRGIRFSDGSPFTADDVVFSLDALKNPKSGAVQGDQLSGGGAYPSWSKLDAHTVQIVFPKQSGLGLRALDSIAILPKARLGKALQAGTFAEAWGPATPPSELAGLGAFRLKQYERGVRIVLERNPYYWKTDRSNQRLPFLDTLTFLIVPDRNAETLRFEAGELDLMNVLSPDNFARLRRSGSRVVLRDAGPGLLVEFLWFNLNSPRIVGGKQNVDSEKSRVFNNSSFRRGVSHAINREGMARALYLGLGTPQFGPTSSGNRTWHNAGIERTEFDLKKTRQLFAAAGLRDSNGDGTLEIGATGRPLEITLLTARGNAARENMSQVIQSDLARAGLKVAVETLPVNELITRMLQSTAYEAVLFGFTPTDVAPDLQADLWYSRGTNHFWHPGQAKPATEWEARIDALTGTLIGSIDDSARRRAFNEIQAIWARELPAIPTIAANILTGWSTALGNVRPSILPPQLLWNAEELTKRPGAGNR